jgi:hexosaminidase
MRYLLMASLLALTVASGAAPAPARSPLELTWKLKQDVFGTDDVSVAVFTLTNRDSRPLPGRGWTVYFTALHEARSATVTGGFRIENVTGSLHRLAPGPDFAGLDPGQSVEVEYRTGLLTNNSFAPNGVYAVLDDAPDVAVAIAYTAVPFERAPQPGTDPHVITAEAQFDGRGRPRHARRGAGARAPTPVSVERGEGSLVTTRPAIDALPGFQPRPSSRRSTWRRFRGAGDAAPAAGAP